MTLLFMDGFDSVSVITKPEWAPTPTWNSFTGRDGSANGAAGFATAGNLNRLLTLPTAAATCFAGVAFLPNNAGAFGSSLSGLLVFASGSGTIQLWLRCNAAGQIEAHLGSGSGTLLATGTAVLQQGIWAHIQVNVVLATSAANGGKLEVRVNGVTDINYTGQTSAANSSVTGLMLPINQSSGVWDDMWVCDAVDATATQGRAFNSFLGDLKVATLIPTADTATAQWTPSTGSNHAATVDETPPNTTDYVSTPTVGNRDLYDVTDLPANTTGVLAYRVGMYAQKSDAGAMSVKPVVKDPAGTVAQAAVALSTSWAPGYGPLTTKKTDGSLPTVADMNATQVGIEAA